MISIIIVNYHVKKELFACLHSIYQSKPKVKFEIIVVDNDDHKTIEKDLKKEFPKVRYIKNNNKGFGQGNNVGASFAKGEYLFFLNPDTKISKNTIDDLSSYLDKNKKVGVVAPLLYDQDGKLVRLQGARILTPLKAVFSFSLISKLFPKNPIVKRYWYLDEWNKKSIKEVESIPGTAFVIRKEIYEKVNGFDEKFFLYFEEHDLCKRVIEQGSKIVMLPNAKVFHSLGSSTKKAKKDVSLIFRQSRFYYLKKHFGIIKAFLAERIMRTGKFELSLTAIVILGFFLRLTEIDRSMQFIGDQGWFYLSARDIILNGLIPLVGISSSHPWLHQGALWIYLLAGWVWLFHFNPLSGAYLTALLDLLAIIFIYILGRQFFSKGTGFIAAFLYATSPLIILNARMPYHTSPIPLFTILFFYCLLSWINNRKYFFPWLVFCLAILYNLEIATFLFSVITGFVLFFGIWNKKVWAKIFEKKIIFLTLLGFLIPMLPMLLYDINHGFAQTFKFIIWIGYRILVFFGYPALNPSDGASIQSMLGFAGQSLTKLVFPYSSYLALSLFGLSVLTISFLLKKKNINLIILLFSNIVLILGFLGTGTPSDAYLPMLFPGLLLILAIAFETLIKFKQLSFLGGLLLLFIILGNLHFLISNNYTLTGKDSYILRLDAAKKVVKEAGQKEYNLIGKGPGSQFKSFTMNYEYLTWYLGHGPSKQKESLKFIITENRNGIKIEKK